MPDTVEFILDDGSTVAVAPLARAGSSAVGLSEHFETAEKTLRQALAPVTAAATEVMDGFRRLAQAITGAACEPRRALTSRAAVASQSRVFSASSSATRARSHPAGSDGGVGGLPGTSRTSPEPTISNQGRHAEPALTNQARPARPSLPGRTHSHSA